MPDIEVPCGRVPPGRSFSEASDSAAPEELLTALLDVESAAGMREALLRWEGAQSQQRAQCRSRAVCINNQYDIKLYHT